MDGIIIIDKPAGWTSHDVVARVRRILREKRVGHTGTLDPFATGVLVTLIGRATRLAQFLSGAEKEYEATVRLGYATDTGDLTGTRREDATGATDCTTLVRAQVEAALAALRGDIEQVPPMYSAKKVAGKKLYELARRGEEVERKAVHIRISEFEISAAEDGTFLRRNDDGTCDVRTRVVCSAGTYVRVLAESVGARLGTGAHLSALRRTRAGEFRIERAFVLEELEQQFEAGAGRELLVPLETALPHLPSVHLKNEEARRVRHGAAVHAEARPGFDDGAHVQMLDDGGVLLAVGVYDAARGLLHPRVMLAVE
ncbi:MAG: tRNA pseudouridine55 synthase [Acidobacteriota bacterium]|nr:tRNA pseudouridine55 synthase [Acidobacteriota bacterium]MDT7778170.1 tRNA pseudouridine55 synthase [Acidobacteriota bacterium]